MMNTDYVIKVKIRRDQDKVNPVSYYWAGINEENTHMFITQGDKAKRLHSLEEATVEKMQLLSLPYVAQCDVKTCTVR